MSQSAARSGPVRGQDAHRVDDRVAGSRGAAAGGDACEQRGHAEDEETNAGWPSSMPTLNASSAIGTSRCGSPASASAPAKPKPCSSPNASAAIHGRRRGRGVVHVLARELDREQQHARRDQHLDRTRRHVRDAERRRRQRDAVADGERGDGLDQEPRRRHEQQQTEHEEQVVGARQDVLDAERDVVVQHGPAARRRGHDEHRHARVEHRLRAGPVGAIEQQECRDARHLEAVHADALADESLGAAVDGPARLRAIAEVDLLSPIRPPCSAPADVASRRRRAGGSSTTSMRRRRLGLLLAQQREQRRLEAVRSHRARARERGSRRSRRALQRPAAAAGHFAGSPSRATRPESTSSG